MEESTYLCIVTIQFRPSCNQTKKTRLFPGFFVLVWQKLYDLIFIHIVS